MTILSLQRARGVRAFTLVELLVATVVLLIILLMLVAMVNSTSTIWRTTSAKVEQFRAARTAFESINRHLSQATLNTYYDYFRDSKGTPRRYIRQSDLRFISGKAESLVPSDGTGDKPPKKFPGHAVFFMAPLGFASSDKETQDQYNAGAYTYSSMDNLLNTWGYFIEYGSDYNYRPPFLNVANSGFTPPPERYRYRLMEMMVPSDQITIYRKTSVADSSMYVNHDWFSDFLRLPAISQTTSPAESPTVQTRPTHLLAENIISLVIFPQLSAKDQATLNATTGQNTMLAPGYSYDSTYDPAKGGTVTLTQAQKRTDPHNQLPPVIQVTMIAMDETSASRLETIKKSQGGGVDDPPQLLDGVLKQYFQTAELGAPQSDTTANNYSKDLKDLQADLVNSNKVGQHVTFRTFTTSISLRAAKWSQD